MIYHDYTYILTAVYDLREIDEFTGKRLLLEPGQGNICNRCSREHAKVYEVKREQDGKEFTVGSTCCRKLFGWEPEQAETRRMEKEVRKQAQDRAYQRLLAIATPIAEEVKALPLPHINVIDELYAGSRYPQLVYGAEGSTVKVWSLKSEGLTDERRRCFYSAWQSEQATKRIEALYPVTVPVDTNRHKRSKLGQVLRDLLGNDFL